MLRERQCQENEKTSHKQGTTFGANKQRTQHNPVQKLTSICTDGK